MNIIPFNRPFAALGAGNFRIDYPVPVFMIGLVMRSMILK